MQFIDSFKKNKSKALKTIIWTLYSVSVFVLISAKRVSFYSETVTECKD
jgi:hypothetical protein